MLRKSIAVGIVALLAAVLAATALARRDSTPTIVGTVGPGYTIELTQNGKVVKTLKAAPTSSSSTTRRRSTPGRSTARTATRRTSRRSRSSARRRFAVNFKAGKYKYYCPAHESMMFGRFTVK